MERLTKRAAHGYEAADLEAALYRLGRWEDLYESLTSQRDGIAAQMQALKAQGKDKTATYRQHFANKLMLIDLISRLEIWG